MSDTSSLPFALTEEDVGKWLDSISGLPPVNAGSQLNQAFKVLKKEDAAGPELLAVLIKLTPPTLHVANTLAVSMKPGAQQGKHAKIAKLNLQLYRHLALLFHSLVEVEVVSVEQKLQASYYALQLIGHYLRISSLLHELPSSTLWQKSGQLFSFAFENELLQHNIFSKIAEFRNQPSVENVLKRNILFSLAAFHKLSVADNQAIFGFANQYAHLIQINYEQTRNCHFVWHYKDGFPNQVSKSDQPLPPKAVAINTTALLPHLQISSFQPVISKPELERLTHHLSGYDKLLNDSIPSAPVLFKMLHGFQEVYGSLHHAEKLSRIYKLSAQAKTETQNSDLSLEPLEYEKSLQNAFSKPEPALDKDGKEISNTVKILQNKSKDFFNVETRNANVQIGDLVILVNNNNATLTGVVRNSKAIVNTQSTMLLIERIYGMLSTRVVQSGPYQDAEAIMINADSDHPRIILGVRRYHNGTELPLKDITVRLDGLIDYSPYFVCFQANLP